MKENLLIDSLYLLSTVADSPPPLRSMQAPFVPGTAYSQLSDGFCKQGNSLCIG